MKMLFAPSIVLIITVFAGLFNCALQGAVFLAPSSIHAPAYIAINEQSGAWTQIPHTETERHFYFSYEQYSFGRKKTFSRKEIRQFFISDSNAFAYYNAEGRRFALLKATDAETKAKYSCWLDRRLPETSLIINDDCKISEDTRLKSVEIIFLRPTGILEKIRTIKKELYG